MKWWTDENPIPYSDETFNRIINPKENVESKVRNMIEITTLNDPYFELIVMKDRYEMPRTEAIYYYIRNAFAHGSFEVLTVGKEHIYMIENAKGKDVKARMRLKESTLLEYIKLSKLTVKEIKELQKPRKKRNIRLTSKLFYIINNI